MVEEFQNIKAYFLANQAWLLSGLIVCVIIILFLLTIFPLLLRHLAIWIRAKQDYQLARGTHHLKQIRTSLKILNKKIESLENLEENYKKDIIHSEENRSRDLSRQLVGLIVESSLIEVPGIGWKLRNAIIGRCFDSTLESLKYAYTKVHGIGDEKQWAISSWADGIKKKLPQLLKQDFPNKERINEKYNEEQLRLKEGLKDTEKKLSNLHEIRNPALLEEKRLGRIKISHFVATYKADSNVYEEVHEYLKGAFPEWRNMPPWFKTLISEYSN